MSEQKIKKEPMFCPYCSEEVTTDLTYCQACRITVFYCPQCHQPLPRENRLCPHCGTEIKG